MVAHLLAAVWWASKITFSVDRMGSLVEKLETVIETHSKEFYGKEEAREQIARRDVEIKDLWGGVNSVRQELQRCKDNHLK